MEPVRGIARETLEFILSVCESSYPDEFAGLLREENGIITEVLMLPGTESSDRNAVIKLFMMPNVESVGSVHSHPGSRTTPSQEDLRMFGKTGNRHIIVGAPYGEDNWVCYDRNGNVVDLPVLDVDLEDTEII
jgi:proteasome lid subunit RPN8/RPN11